MSKSASRRPLPRQFGASLAVLCGLLLAASFGGCRDSERPASSPPIPARQPDSSQPEPRSAAPAPTPPPPRPKRPAAAEPPHHTPLVRHSGSLKGPLEYVVVEPPNAAPDTPLVLALHGRGDRPESFARLAEDMGLPVRTIAVRGPLRWGLRDGRQWFDSTGNVAAQASQRVEELATLVAQLKQTYPKAPKPLIYGFSQGAMLTLQAVARRPDLFAGAAALSGSLLSTEGNRKVDTPVPLLVTVGAKDRMVSPELTRAAVKVLRELGHDPKVVGFAGGHQVTPVLPQLKAFLAEHTKTSGGR